jgi:hypothetical protein
MPEFSVNLKGNWRAYIDAPTPLSEPLGTVTIDGKTGALLKIKVGQRHTYVQAIGEETTEIDGRRVAGELKRGRPNPKQRRFENRVGIMLDDESIEIANRLGGGNISEGIRKALRIAAQAE